MSLNYSLHHPYKGLSDLLNCSFKWLIQKSWFISKHIDLFLSESDVKLIINQSFWTNVLNKWFSESLINPSSGQEELKRSVAPRCTDLIIDETKLTTLLYLIIKQPYTKAVIKARFSISTSTFKSNHPSFG